MGRRRHRRRPVVVTALAAATLAEQFQARLKAALAKAAAGEPDAIELMARMLVGGGYRIPVEGKGTKTSLQTSDIAAAVGYMGNRLERHTAMAVATRAGDVQVARLSLLAYRKVVRALRSLRPVPLDLHEPADRWRLRLVVFDAAHELVWPECRQPYGDLAKLAKMRKADYIAAHKCATSELQETLNNARRSFQTRLFAHSVSQE